MNLEQLLKKPKFKTPVRYWRAPGVFGIKAYAQNIDPAFDIQGLPDPFQVFFPAAFSNIYVTTIYVTSLLISPPAGWTDSEQNIVTLTTGATTRNEKSNATRAIPFTPSNETITVRFNYRITSYSGTIIGYDDFTFTIYWETIADGIVVSTEDFETAPPPPPPYIFDGWYCNPQPPSYPQWNRNSTRYVHGAYSLECTMQAMSEGYLEKTVDLVSGSRGYIFGFFAHELIGRVRFTVVTPVESLDIVYTGSSAYQWRRWGCRLTPAAPNTVRLYFRNYWGTTYTLSYIDYIRWVRFT